MSLAISIASASDPLFHDKYGPGFPQSTARDIVSGNTLPSDQSTPESIRGFSLNFGGIFSAWVSAWWNVKT
jgi:hypothetical protein